MGFKLRVFEFCKHRQVNGVGQQQIIQGFGNGGAQGGSDARAVQGQVNVGTRFVVSFGTRPVQHGPLDRGVVRQHGANLIHRAFGQSVFHVSGSACALRVVKVFAIAAKAG